jgi:RHS repeat-associated protein
MHESGRHYFVDQLGTTRTITTGNGTGQTAGQLCYDADFSPYGQEISYSARLQTTACPPNYRFTGYEYDSATGLNYAFARYYSPRLGRFLSTDPLGGSVGDLQSHNAYSYVENNPLNFSDPLGMGPHCKSGDPRPECHGPGCLNPNAGCFGGPACWAVTNGAACTNSGNPNDPTCLLDGVATSCIVALGGSGSILIAGDCTRLNADSPQICSPSYLITLNLGGNSSGGGQSGGLPCIQSIFRLLLSP